MSLGVLNNLSAMYAENNLNNTTNSLNTVLQQLSSGSKINSGADDAAGLSLVDGLQANSVALAQSKTNAQEGVGLLQVADGALSQVTSLLNRAVTLATEASNGTLNSSQDTAANQEYQSILSEINNIGTTTTYNDTSVFGNGTTNIYTGDSSTQGASIDALNISSLSSANVGDSGGVMAYSSGQSSVFLNLSTSTQNAQSTDTLNGAGTSTLDVSYLVKGADGASTPATTTITVGGTGNAQPNTAQGMINAINNAGLGLTATFSTAAQSGVANGGTETGIQISGGIISAGVDPSASTTSGTLNPSEITNGDLALGQTITVNSGSTNVATFQVTSTNDTLEQVAAQINAGAGGAAGSAGMVTANLVTNSANQQTSLQLADAANGGALSVTVTPGTIAPNALTAGTVVTAANSPVNVQFTQTGTGNTGGFATATLAIPGGVADNNTTASNLTGSITLTNGTATKTFSAGTGSTAGVIYLGASGDNTNSLENLATAITNNLGATAAATTAGIAITSNTTGTGTIAESGTTTLAATLNDSVTSNVAGLAATQGSDGSTVISMTGDGMGIANNGSTALTAGTHITLQNGSGTAVTITMGTNAGDVIGANGNTTAAITTTANTAQGLANAINDNTTQLGMTAAIANGVLTVSSTAVGTSIVASAVNLAGTQALTETPVNGGDPTTANHSSGNFTIDTGNPVDGSLTTYGDTLSGSMTVTNNGITDTFAMGTVGGPAGAIYTGATTLASLQQAISGASGLDVNATLDNAAGAAFTGLHLQSTNYTTTIATGGTGIVDTATVGTDVQSSLAGGGGQYLTDTLSSDNGGILDSLGNALQFSGSFQINETNAHGTGSLTVDVGAAAGTNTAANDTATTMYVGQSGPLTNMNTIAAAITAYEATATNTAGAGQRFDLTAATDPNTGGLVLQAAANNGTDSALSMTVSTLTAAQQYGVGASYSTASAAGEAIVNVGNGSGTIDANSFNDALKNGGTLAITNTVGSESTDGLKTVTFTLGNGGTESGDGTNAVTTAADTMGSLITAIDAQTHMDLSATIVNGALQIESTGGSNTGDLTVVTGGGLSQAYGVGNTGGSVVTNAGSGPEGATNAAVSINTGAGMATAGTDTLAGTLLVQNGSGTAYTYNMGSGSTGANPVTVTNATEQGLVNAINVNTTATGIAATINATTGALQLQSNIADTTITATSALTDSTSASALSGVSGGGSTSYSSNTISLANSIGGATNSLAHNSGADILTGDVSIAANGKTIDFIMGGTGANNVDALTSGSGTVTLSAANSTVQGLENAINSTTVDGASLDLQASTTTGSNAIVNGDILLQSKVANSTVISTATDTTQLQDTLGNAAATATLGSFASASDIVTGSVDFAVGSNQTPVLATIAANTDVDQLVNYINTGSYGSATSLSTPTNAYGVTASLTSGANGYETIKLTSDTYGTAGNITNGSGAGTSLLDHSTAATLSYAQNSGYNIGISNVASSGVYDSSITGETAPSNSPSTGVIAAYTGLSTQSHSSNGVATISYSDGAGQSLSATDLSNQTDAEASLTALNKSITDVAAQDGYIGAQINTLNAVSSVLSTQQENVVSAQNAVQATDYASATSNMSKYEILSQTGISALAQANSMSQEVTKLLQ